MGRFHVAFEILIILRVPFWMNCIPLHDEWRCWWRRWRNRNGDTMESGMTYIFWSRPEAYRVGTGRGSASFRCGAAGKAGRRTRNGVIYLWWRAIVQTSYIALAYTHTRCLPLIKSHSTSIRRIRSQVAVASSCGGDRLLWGIHRMLLRSHRTKRPRRPRKPRNKKQASFRVDESESELYSRKGKMLSLWWVLNNGIIKLQLLIIIFFHWIERKC